MLTICYLVELKKPWRDEQKFANKSFKPKFPCANIAKTIRLHVGQLLLGRWHTRACQPVLAYFVLWEERTSRQVSTGLSFGDQLTLQCLDMPKASVSKFEHIIKSFSFTCINMRFCLVMTWINITASCLAASSTPVWPSIIVVNFLSSLLHNSPAAFLNL